MAQKRQLGYTIYDILPNTEQLSDIIDGDTTGTGDVALDDVGVAADVPTSLIEAGKVDVGATGITIAADTSADGYTPNLEEHDLTHNLAFSITDKDTVAWGSGTIYVGDEAATTYSISAGNTGNMAVRTYIFLDIDVSTTVLQTTTTVSGTAGPNRKLIAVAENGSAQAQFQVYGGIGGLKLPAAGVSISNNNWQYSGTWSITDADTVAWGAGTLTTSDGGSYSISGSNTGNMAAKTFIYFDLGTSSTAFQTTTTAANCVGDGKILIAVAQNATNEARYVVMNDFQLNIDAAQIVAGSITANEIAAGAITASKISVSNLSAIVADMGTITAGTITLDTSGYIRGGATGYLTGTGFFLGYSGGAYKFHVGNPSKYYIAWDGTDLVLNGYEQQGFGDGSDGDVTISTPTTLTSDMYYNNLTVNSTLTTDGYRIYVKGTLDGTGTIDWGTANQGVDGGADSTTGTAGGASSGSGSFVSIAGANGASGVVGGVGGTGGSGSSQSICIGSAGKDGGTGYTCNPGVSGAQAGGPGGTGGAVTSGPNIPVGLSGHSTVRGYDWKSDFSYALYIPQAGAAGGGAGGGASSTAGGGGGGGGASGGIILIACKEWSGSFTIKSVGGKGGNGCSTDGIGDAGTGGGGGAGGNGGAAIIIYHQKSWSGSYNLAGGAAGSAGGGPNNTGTPTAAEAGATGSSYELQAGSMT